MKKLFNPFLAVILVGIIFSGCKKDKEEEVKSFFNYNGTEFNLSQGFLENFGKYSADEGYNVDLTLLSSDFKIYESSGEIDSISGVGDGLNFEIFTSLPDKLDIRDYMYDADETGAAGTFDFGIVVMGYNGSTETGTMFSITGGKVSVTSNGSEYDITLNCTASNGKTITGNYKGSLKYYNYDKKKKSQSSIPAKKFRFSASGN